MRCLGGGHYRVRFHLQWWILILFKWYLVWGYGCSWFSFTSCLGCQGYWYGHFLCFHLQRWLVPIFILLHYFDFCFTCFKFGFSAIFPRNKSASFLRTSIFMVLRVKARRLVLDFSVHWSSLFPHGRLHWSRKFSSSWCFQEIIQLCLQFVILLWWKCRLYNTGSAQLPVLCTIIVPRSGPMYALFWIFHMLCTWCLVVPNMVCWSQSFPPSFLTLK